LSGNCKARTGRNNLAQRFSAGRLQLFHKSRRDDTKCHTRIAATVFTLFSAQKSGQTIFPAISNRNSGHTWLHRAQSRLQKEAMIIGGVEDHVHALLVLPPSLPLSKVVQFLKRQLLEMDQ